ncbi:MAG: SIMPL domain-containing protein [Anaerolineae bacterium]
MNKRLLSAAIPMLVLALALSAVALWLGPVAAPAVAQGAATPLSAGGRSITVVGQGTAYASPDVATVNLGVEVAADTVLDATGQNSDTMAAILTALEDAGVAPEDITTVEYNIFVDQSLVSQGLAETPVYRVINTVSVTIRSLEDIATILDAAIAAGANRIYGVSFTLSDMAAAQAEARAGAMADAQSRAESLAAEIGAEVGGAITISETSAYAIPFTTSAAPAPGAGAGPISPGTLSFVSSVQVTYEMIGGGTPVAVVTSAATGVTGTPQATGTAAITPGTTQTTAATVAGTRAATATPLSATTTAATVVATGTASSSTSGSATVTSVQAQATTLPGIAGMAFRYITVVGAGTTSVTPDIASLDLGVETTSDSVQTAVDENRQAMTDVLAALDAAGVAPEDIRTSSYNIFLDQASASIVGSAQPATPAYRVSNTVNVTIRDLASVGEILDAVVQAGANSIFGISFTREDWTDAEQVARTAAIADAQSRATQLADLAGVQLGQIVSISEVITGGPSPFADRAVAGLGGGAAPISTGQLQFSTSVQVVYSIE